MNFIKLSKVFLLSSSIRIYVNVDVHIVLYTKSNNDRRHKRDTSLPAEVVVYHVIKSRLPIIVSDGSRVHQLLRFVLESRFFSSNQQWPSLDISNKASFTSFNVVIRCVMVKRFAEKCNISQTSVNLILFLTWGSKQRGIIDVRMLCDGTKLSEWWNEDKINWWNYDLCK